VGVRGGCGVIGLRCGKYGSMQFRIIRMLIENDLTVLRAVLTGWGLSRLI